MITVQGPWWTLLIAAGLQLLIELSVHVREAFRDLQIRRAGRPRFGALPDAWNSDNTRRLGDALSEQRKRSL